MIENNENWKEALSRIRNAKTSKSETLNLSRLQLTKLPPELFELEHIKELNLWRNQLTELPTEFTQLKELAELHLSNNKLHSLPENFAQLQHLRELHLRNNQLRSLPENFAQLQHLRELDLSNNKLHSLPENFAQLQHLRELDLSNNKLHSLPDDIIQLRLLDILDLSNNKLHSLPDGIIQLRLLDIVLKEKIWNQNWNKAINLHGNENTLQYPPIEIISQGWGAIESYITQSKKQGKGKLFEAKSIFIGEKGAGKTSLMRALLNLPFDAQEGSTEGIKINSIVLPAEDTGFAKDFHLNLWDSGGEEIYKDIHRFFLTKDTVYILITENGSNDVNHNDVYYWLNSLNIFAPNAPVLIVQNKCDCVKNITDLPFQQYKRKFKNLVPNASLLRTSCIAGQEHTIEILRNKIIDVLRDKTLAANVGNTIPARWVDIRKALRIRQQKGGRTLKYSAFEKVCMTRYNLSKEDVKTLARYFFRIGVFVHYADDKLLKHTVFLDNEWLTKAVYKVIDNETVSSQKGRFSLHDVEAMYHATDYAGQEAEFITLMKKFKICYEVKDDEYICPQRLPIDEPLSLNWDEWHSVDNLHYAFEYPFMPRGILSTFIVNIHQYIIGEPWKHGVVLQHNKTQALIYEDLQERDIHIYIKGEDKHNFLTIIVSTLQNIHQELNNLPHSAKIARSCTECMENPAKAYLFDEERIMRC